MKCLKFRQGRSWPIIFLAHEIILQNPTKRESSDFHYSLSYVSNILLICCVRLHNDQL